MTPREIESQHIAAMTAEYLAQGKPIIHHPVGATAIDPVTGLTPSRHAQWITSVKSSHKSRLEGSAA